MLSHGTFVWLLRLEDAEQFGRIDRDAAVFCPLRRESACLNGAPDVDFARFDPFGRFLKAQDRHCAVSRRSVARRA